MKDLDLWLDFRDAMLIGLAWACGYLTLVGLFS